MKRPSGKAAVRKLGDLHTVNDRIVNVLTENRVKMVFKWKALCSLPDGKGAGRAVLGLDGAVKST